MQFTLGFIIAILLCVSGFAYASFNGYVTKSNHNSIVSDNTTNIMPRLPSIDDN